MTIETTIDLDDDLLSGIYQKGERVTIRGVKLVAEIEMVRTGGERTPIEGKRRVSDIGGDAQNQAPQGHLVHSRDRERIVRTNPVIGLIEVEDDRDHDQNLARVHQHQTKHHHEHKDR